MEQHVTKLYVDWTDDRLSAEQRQEVKAHLANCPQCARRFDILDRTLADGRIAAPSLEPDPYLASRIEAGEVANKTHRSRPSWMRLALGGGMVTAALLIGVVIGYNAAIATRETAAPAIEISDVDTLAEDYYTAWSQSGFGDGSGQWTNPDEETP